MFAIREVARPVERGQLHCKKWPKVLSKGIE